MSRVAGLVYVDLTADREFHPALKVCPQRGVSNCAVDYIRDGRTVNAAAWDKFHFGAVQTGMGRQCYVKPFLTAVTLCYTPAAFFDFKESFSMAKNRKRREAPKQMPKRSMRDRIRNRKRSTAEKIMIVLGIVIALSMILSLVVTLGGSVF